MPFKYIFSCFKLFSDLILIPIIWPPIVNMNNFPVILNELTNETDRLWVSLDLVLISIIGTYSKYGISGTHYIFLLLEFYLASQGLSNFGIT